MHARAVSLPARPTRPAVHLVTPSLPIAPARGVPQCSSLKLAPALVRLQAGAKTGSPNSSDEGSKAWLPRPLRRKKMTSKGPWLAAQRLPSSERPDAG